MIQWLLIMSSLSMAAQPIAPVLSTDLIQATTLWRTFTLTQVEGLDWATCILGSIRCIEDSDLNNSDLNNSEADGDQDVTFLNINPPAGHKRHVDNDKHRPTFTLMMGRPQAEEGDVITGTCFVPDNRGGLRALRYEFTITEDATENESTVTAHRVASHELDHI